MIFQQEDGTYVVDCIHDPDLRCCLDCQEIAAKRFIYNDIPRTKWPLWLQDKFCDATKESVTKEVEDYKKSSKRTNALLERILSKLQDFPFL